MNTMKSTLKIGRLLFRTKKEAIEHFRKVLNSYQCGQVLSCTDRDDVVALLQLHENSKEKIGTGIKDIKVEEIKYGKKCFHIIRTDSSIDHFSYLKCINGDYSPQVKFSRACRESIQSDLTEAKLLYFKNNSSNGKVCCQESNELRTWEELCVDHRQPNTFSVIVDRFIELHNIDISSVAYKETIENIFEFEDAELKNKFRSYHKSKANLRLVKKELNLSRSHLARVTRQKKDITIS